jgi:iron complex transport system permease protein
LFAGPPLKKFMSVSVKFILLVVLVIAAFFLSLFFGGTQPLGEGPSADFIFSEIRMPKSVTAIAAGSSLAVCGLVLQVLFRNPLAGPYVLGISSGASLMVAIVMLAGHFIGNLSHAGGRAVTLLAAICGSLAVMLFILLVARKIASNVVLLLVGLLLSQACGAIEASLAYFADPGNLKTFVVWGMGSLSATTTGDVKIFLPVVLLLLSGVLFYMKPLNGLLLGAEYAQSAGINVKKSRIALILLSSGLTGVTTAFCGPIAFAGIAMPVVSRMLFPTPRQEVHFASCILLGSLLLLLADAAGHSLAGETALPVNIITTFIGAPLVVWLMLRNKTW